MPQTTEKEILNPNWSHFTANTRQFQLWSIFGADTTNNIVQLKCTSKHHIDDFAQICNLTPEKQFVMDKKYTKKNVVTEMEEVGNRKLGAEATM